MQLRAEISVELEAVDFVGPTFANAIEALENAGQAHNRVSGCLGLHANGMNPGG